MKVGDVACVERKALQRDQGEVRGGGVMMGAVDMAMHATARAGRAVQSQ